MRKTGGAFGRISFVAATALMAIALVPIHVHAEPGDLATRQTQYKAIRSGAESLQKAIEALDKGEEKFKGHRVAARKLVREALTELDEAVKYANSHNEAGEKTKMFFEPDRAKQASSQSKYPAIRGAANRILEGGKALDNGFDKFGGHRLKAIRQLNEALDELEKAVKEGN